MPTDQDKPSQKAIDMNIGKLTPTQREILKAAAMRLDGNIEPMPEKINAGIKPNVIQGLLKRGVITQSGNEYVINDNGLIAIGVKPKLNPPIPSRTTTSKTDNLKTSISESAKAISSSQTVKADKPKSKQDAVLDLLKRPDGATLDDLTEATQWQKHSVRGFLSHTVKKRLRMRLLSEKLENGDRRYRISEETNAVIQSEQE